MRITVAGGSGFIGRRLVQVLLEQNHTVQVLSRDPATTAKTLASSPRLGTAGYNPLDPTSWADKLQGSDGVINLVGAPLAGVRWTPERKAEIRRSRVEVTAALVQGLAQLDQKPQVLINSSAIGYYGPRDDTALVETSAPGEGFLAQLTQDWESAAQPAQELGIRVVMLRTGIVLAAEGGALAQMVGPFQAFMGGPIGQGSQWLSWIHRDDLVKLIVFALQTEGVSGVLNGTAPEPLTMADFCHTLGQVMGRPSWLPVPEIALEMLFGEAAQVVLTGQRVLPAAAEAAGFQFTYPQLKSALTEILVTPHS